eukprot:gene17250-biopygen1692
MRCAKAALERLALVVACLRYLLVSCRRHQRYEMSDRAVLCGRALNAAYRAPRLSWAAAGHASVHGIQSVSQFSSVSSVSRRNLFTPVLGGCRTCLSQSVQFPAGMHGRVGLHLPRPPRPARPAHTQRGCGGGPPTKRARPARPRSWARCCPPAPPLMLAVPLHARHRRERREVEVDEGPEGPEACRRVCPAAPRPTERLLDCTRASTRRHMPLGIDTDHLEFRYGHHTGLPALCWGRRGEVLRREGGLRCCSNSPRARRGAICLSPVPAEG